MTPLGQWDREELFVGGRFVAPAETNLAEVISPSTEEAIARVPLATAGDVDAAVAAARRAFDEGGWPRWPVADRAAAVRSLADALDARSGEIAELITAEMGAPVAFCVSDHVTIPLAALRYYADLAETFPGEVTRSAGSGTSLVWHDPIGVVAAIVPWNAPFRSVMNKLAPALVAGCPVVVKPAPETPLDAYVLAECVVAAGIPEGVVSILPGDAVVGDHLVGHPGIDMVAFTGSTRAGRHIMARCAERVAPLTLELGGKSAAIVLDDADLASTAKRILPLVLGNTGQNCMAQSRVLVSRARHDDLLDALVAAAGRWKVGDPWDPATLVGPVVSRRQHERVLGYLRAGIDEGATAVIGGGRPDGLPTGFYVEPTIFDGVTPDMTVAREEIFGPVLSVLTYTDVDDAVRIANDSDYGLAGSVWSADQDAALAVAARLRTGMVRINGAPQALDAPFGGVKRSGFGREYGPEGLQSFLVTKSIAVRADPKR